MFFDRIEGDVAHALVCDMNELYEKTYISE